MWKQTLLSCSLLSPPCREQGLPAIQKMKPETKTRVLPTVHLPTAKMTLSAPCESNKGQSPALLLQAFLSVLMLTFYFTPGRCFWCTSPSFLPYHPLILHRFVLENSEFSLHETNPESTLQLQMKNQAKGPDQNLSKAKSFVLAAHDLLR